MYDIRSSDPKTMKQSLIEFSQSKAKEGVNAAAL